MPLCKDCSSITLELLLPPATGHGFKVASDLNALRERTAACNLCNLLYQALSSLPVPPATLPDRSVWLTGIVTTAPGDGQNLDPTQMSGIIVACNGRSATLNLCQLSNTNPLMGRLITETITSTDVAAFITAQLEGCRGVAHTRCQQVITGQPLDPDYVPPRLWSVTDNCLVDTKADHITSVTYVALSYLWGENGRTSVGPVRTLKANKEPRREPKLSETAHGNWPAVYRAAMAITRALQQKYLWIDALCIVQDDAADVQKHFSSLMNRIYQNSLVTICAVVDGAEKDPMLPRTVTQERVNIVNDRYCVTPRLGNPAIDVGGETSGPQPRWAMRGWPFQERVLPSKCVFLTSHQLYWECRGVLREEGGMIHPPTVYKRDTNQQPQRNWQQMVRDYTRRELGWKSDKIPAVLGILRQLAGNTMEAAVEYGFLTQRIARDLLWEGSVGPKAVPLTKLQLRPDELPKVPVPHAWSWAFWDGTVDFENYLETATLTPNTSYTIEMTGELKITGAIYTELRGGASMDDKVIAGPTDIVYTVIHNNVTSLMDLRDDGDIRGWIAFDRDPIRNGASVDEKKNLICIKVSTTSWGTNSEHPTKHAANVLVVQRRNTPLELVARVGVGQLWDDDNTPWTAAIRALRVVSPANI